MMMFNKKKWHESLLNVSPLILTVACLLLIVLLGVFANSNYQREKELLTKGIAQKGLTLVRFITSNVSRSIHEDLRSDRFKESLWKSHMVEALDQASEQPGVDFIFILDSSNNILLSAGEKLQPDLTEDTVNHFAKSSFKENRSKGWKSRIITDTRNNKRKFQLAIHYKSPNMMRGGMSNSPGKGGRMMSRFKHHPQFRPVQKELIELFQKHPYFIVQLDFEQFSSPLNRQVIQIVIIILVILLVVIGAMLSVMTLRGLRGSQVRIGKMQAFTDILVSSLPVGLIATDSSGTIQICNHAVQELLTISDHEVTGKAPQGCLPEGVASTFSGTLLSDEDGQQKEIEIINEAGKKRNLHVASQVVFDKTGHFAGEVLLVRDLTEVKTLEKELQRSERLAALGKMAAGVAHELRNPLSSIKGLAVLLKKLADDEGKSSETSEILVKEVERLNRSIGELLDYAKPENLLKEDASISEILEKTKSLIDIDATVFGVKILLEYNDNLPRIKIDKDKINQLFLNLYLNSLQAMPDGGILKVTTTMKHGMLCVDVRDNGSGISAENLNKIQDPYFTTKSDGTGLGLSMSSKIVEEHGGRMEISSRVGEYTHVRVLLPCPEI